MEDHVRRHALFLFLGLYSRAASARARPRGRRDGLLALLIVFLLLTVLTCPFQQLVDGGGLVGVDLFRPVTGDNLDDEPDVQPAGPCLRV